MGLSILQREFTQADYRAFNRRLEVSLQALKLLLARPEFGVGPATLGAELELYLVDAQGQAALQNQTVISALNDPRFTLELNRYNLEYNADYQLLQGRPFSALATAFERALKRGQKVARKNDARLVSIGILPTLKQRDFGHHVMTDTDRYHALTDSLLKLRHGKPFTISIDGPEPLSLEADHVTYEGANTSLQLHWRVLPDAFTDAYNAVQLATPLVLALSANSPLLLGHELWAETRIALFRQSIDSRDPARVGWQLPARVSFRKGWLRDGAYELFAEAVRLYPPLLPVCGNENPLAVIAADGMPVLEELRLHEGTVWHWNRPVFDPAAGGHLRIEMRTLPAGPSVQDMLANTAWLLGLAAGLMPRINEILPAIPFELARHNFYVAAQLGIEAALVWPTGRSPAPRELPVTRLAKSVRPLVEEGLARLGVSGRERENWLHVMDARIEAATNGAHWQLQALHRYQKRCSRDAALQAMLELYIEHQSSKCPVAEWALPR